jgi:transposase
MSNQPLTIGLDLGDRSSFYCVLNEAGGVILEERVTTSPKAMRKIFEKMPRSRIALEIGTHSPWVSRLLTELGHEAIVAHAPNVRLIGESRRKGRPAGCAGTGEVSPDRSAVALADPTPQRTGAGRSVGDPGALCTGASQDGAGLCGTWTDQVVRRTISGRNSKNFNPATSETLSSQLQAALAPLLAALESLTARTREYDAQIEQLARESYPEVAL